MRIKRFVVPLTALALVLSLAAPVTAASPNGKADSRGHKGDNLPGALAKKQMALKQKAQEMVLKGQAKAVGKNKVVQVAKGQFVELALEGEDQILTLLGEFGDAEAIHDHGEELGVIDHNGDPGPSHNEIPEPDRDFDNTTIWTGDFSQAHYDDLLYSKGTNPSMANFYLEQSSGRYSVDGYVSDWVEVPFNAAAYGSNYCGSIVCTRDVGRFMMDQGIAWYNEALATMTPAEIDAFLAPFDVWDRYDYDGDGEFDEPDGYIDHFQSVHAGEGEETGGGEFGEDAIWSHRSYANAGPQGAAGPTVGGTVVPFGGMRLGSSSKWVGDYTVEPENGGVGVFAHEFAHDYNIPDLYDTSGNTGGAENGTAWWTIMSQGSYGTVNGIDLGSAPVHFGAWEKFQLGWLNYDVAVAGKKSSHKLGPAETNTKQAQGLFVVLPDKVVTRNVGLPFAGSSFYYSGAADSLDTTMTRSVTLPAGAVTLAAKVRYNIEEDFDYAYLSVNGTLIDTNVSNSSVVPEGIEGLSAGWVDLNADLSGFAGQTVTIGFGYWTDGGVQGATGASPAGISIDDIAITGQATDGAESDAGWTYDSNIEGTGFHVTSGSETFEYFNAYVAEYRQYRGYDKALELGPYNFTGDPGPDWVEHFPYQDGLLISYWDSSWTNNNVGEHPGEGLLLPIDAHPQIEHWSDGSTIRPRIQSYDSTFGFWATDALTLHSGDLVANIASKPGVLKFNDLNDYWVSSDPGDAPGDGRYQAEWNSVNTPNTGTTIRIVNLSAQGQFMQVNVNN